MHYHFTHIYIQPQSKDTLFYPHTILQARKSTVIHHHPIDRLHSKFYNVHENVLSSLLSWEPIQENAHHVDFISSNLAVSQLFPVFFVLDCLKEHRPHIL